ncbi:hypothetical protein [Nonomuraea sp. KM90]|uniref:hypothetical protein n=1 Tax=Nonomuraea sp. KM90 TaxID=3457428 RepID=UPI003FCD0916
MPAVAVPKAMVYPADVADEVATVARHAHAINGNAATVEAALCAAQAVADDRQSYPDELDQGIRGEFAFNEARAAPCAAGAWPHMRDGGQAAKHAQRALDVYAAMPSNCHPFSPIAGVTIDPTKLREAMVDGYVVSGHLRTPEVIGAFRAVERHTFIPDADVEAAYVDAPCRSSTHRR